MRVRSLIEILTLTVSCGLAACGSGGEDSGVAGSGGTGGAGGAGGGGAGAGGSSSAAAEGPSGLFEIHYDSASSIAAIGGVMRDRPVASQVIWEKKEIQGDCSLYKPRYPFCESCAEPNICVETNVCRSQSVGQSVGDVTLTGLNSASKPLSLTFVGGDYSSAETLTLPACTAGETVGLSATGAGAYPAFSVQASCIAPLVLVNPSAALESGKPFTINWTPGTVAGARITLEFDLSHHGGSKGQIRCETADSGSLQVSGTLIKTLMDLGVTGYPWLTISREAKGTTPVGSGQAQLKVYSDEKLILEVPGVKSCDKDSDCPTGQTCLSPSSMCGIACATSADCPSGQTCQTSSKSCK